MNAAALPAHAVAGERDALRVERQRGREPVAHPVHAPQRVGKDERARGGRVRPGEAIVARRPADPERLQNLHRAAGSPRMEIVLRQDEPRSRRIRAHLRILRGRPWLEVAVVPIAAVQRDDRRRVRGRRALRSLPHRKHPRRAIPVRIRHQRIIRTLVRIIVAAIYPMRVKPVGPPGAVRAAELEMRLHRIRRLRDEPRARCRRRGERALLRHPKIHRRGRVRRVGEDTFIARELIRPRARRIRDAPRRPRRHHREPLRLPVLREQAPHLRRQRHIHHRRGRAHVNAIRARRRCHMLPHQPSLPCRVPRAEIRLGVGLDAKKRKQRQDQRGDGAMPF